MVADNGTATDWRTENERRIYRAAGIGDAEQVDKWTANIVQWLAGWDDHTIRGVEALLAAARPYHPKGREHTEACRDGLHRTVSQMAARGVESQATEDDVQTWIVAVGHAADQLDRMLLDRMLHPHEGMAAERASLSAPDDSEGAQR